MLFVFVNTHTHTHTHTHTYIYIYIYIYIPIFGEAKTGGYVKLLKLADRFSTVRKLTYSFL